VSNDVDLAKVFSKPDGVSINEGERLRFARQVLFWLAMICIGVFIAHGYDSKNEGINQIFELVKIGALPLVTLVVSFYFPNSSTK
jgi:hypothetical protein